MDPHGDPGWSAGKPDSHRVVVWDHCYTGQCRSQEREGQVPDPRPGPSQEAHREVLPCPRRDEGPKGTAGHTALNSV
jgi:hypothetical protein